MRSIFVIVFLVFTQFSLSAQVKLKVAVYDSTNHHLAYAGITLSNKQDHANRSMQTDSLGNVEFPQLQPGTYTLLVSFTGYEKYQLEVPVNKDTVVNIVLKRSGILLKEVLVTAGKTSIENNQEKLVYNVSANSTANGSDVLTVIEKIPGIKVSGNEISIAGKGGLSVMVNDRIVRLSGLELARYLRSISSNQVSKIELIKNPSANYDAEGNAGLLNITTKHNLRQGLSGDVQLSNRRWLHNPATVYGTSNYWMFNGSGNLNYNSARWSAYSSINIDQDHELEGFETDVYYPKQSWLQTDTGDYRWHNFNIMAGVDYKLNSGTTIGISYMGGKNIYKGSDHVNNPVYNSSGSLDSTLITYATYHPVAISNAGNIHAAINLDKKGKRLLLNADYFNYNRNDRSNFESNSYLADGQLNASGNIRYFDVNKQNISVYTFKADADIPASFAIFSFGVKTSFIDNYSNAFYYNKDSNDHLTYNTDLSNEFKYDENTQSLYANMNKENGTWKYQTGIRAEHTETKGYSYTLKQTNINNYIRLFPSLSVSYQSDTANTFALSFGRRINRPSFWNLNPFKSLFTAYSYGEGNPFLQPEYNSNFELSHSYKNLLISSVFLNITDNGFNNVTIASANTNLVYTVPLNFIKIYRTGVSENISFQLFKWLDNHNQLTFYHTNAHSNIDYIKSINGFGAYLATNNTVYFNAAKTIATSVNFWYQFPEIDHIGRSDAYYKMDIGFTALALEKKLNITLNLNDAFQTGASAVTTTVNGITQKFTNFQINRFVQLSVSYRFGRESNAEKPATGNKDERGRIH